MNLLEKKKKKYIPKILEAVIETWGEEYRYILVEKANKIKNINYIDERGILHYHRFLENCIQKYLSLKFLEEIGVDTSQDDKNLGLPLDSNTKEQMNQYFGNRCIFSPDFWKDAKGIFAFDKEVIEEGLKQVKLLNEKYKISTEIEKNIPKFHFIYRKRYWNGQEECYLGWERKRGLLNQFNNYLLGKEENPFLVNTLAPLTPLGTFPNGASVPNGKMLNKKSSQKGQMPQKETSPMGT